MNILQTTLIAGLISSAIMPRLACASSNDIDLFSLSLKDLADIQITSVSKRSQKASEVAAAIYVITSEDIKRSGATSIPEALRIAPGVNVARAGSGQWAISIRGFNAQFSNKLLILIDGRSVYTPMFSGTLWDVQDTLLEDIDRIEVVRGPGGTIWGANAVNGVINIITKDSKDTQGAIATYQHGLQEQKSAVRYGGKAGESTNFRAFAQQTHNREFELSDGSGANDAMDRWRTGMRIDVDDLSYGDLSFQSELYSGTENHDLLLPIVTAPFSALEKDKWDTLGGHLLANWNYDNGSNQYSIKGYYDYASRDTYFFESDIQTFDVDFNHSFKASPRHNMIWGLGYRITDINIKNTDILSYNPSQRTDDIISAFIQDKIDIYNNEAFLTIGSKFEYNDYTNFEWQPSARLSWLIDDKQTLWASVSRAVRTPSITSHNISIAVAAAASSASPTGSLLARQIGSENVKSEELIAYETGYRRQISDNATIDLTAFYNDYPTLTSDSSGAPYLDSNSRFGVHAVLPFTGASDSSGNTFGFEASTDWKATPHWMLSAGYSYMEMDINGSSTFVSGEGRSPQHQANIESHYTPNSNWEFDNTLYYVDKLEPTATTTIPEYWRLDTRIAYNFDNGMSFSLVGQNLLDNQKPEFSSFIYNRQIETPRTIYGKISWKF